MYKNFTLHHPRKSELQGGTTHHCAICLPGAFGCAYGDARNRVSADGAYENFVDGPYFEMIDCVNSGKIVLAAPSSSKTPSYVLRMKQFAGGLIGLGGHLDIDGAYVGTANTPCEIGKSNLSFANGGIFGIMISQCQVQNCYANLKILSACAGSTMKYYAVLAGEIKGGTSSQGGLTKDSTDATVYYADSSFKNCKAKGTIAHGTTVAGVTTETLKSSNIGNFLFCSYDAADSVIGAFDITGTGYWE